MVKEKNIFIPVMTSFFLGSILFSYVFKAEDGKISGELSPLCSVE
jgi:hypothetical protein